MKDLTPRKSDLDAIEIASTDEICALQLKRLKWSLHHDYDNVAMFPKRCDEKGVHPDDLKTLEDLTKFPFTYKNDLRDNYPVDLFAVPSEQIIRIHASTGTTGTTGKPTVVGYSRDDIGNWAGPGAHYGIERPGATVVPIARMLTKRIKDIVGVSAEIIVGNPGEVARSQGKAVRFVNNRGKG